ncbi:MAG: hypothetical protein A2Y15_01545 [Clostridiales bacterium GWF2_36_10]|nr:MAG: hypothetical protein A2Y15_01545 [Clostridiales bacterium GWF2_36_10]HAN22132.1 TIGR04002 family protein [Clostridiales bacterium]
MQKNIKRLTITALAAALVFIFTRFFSMTYAGGNGYIHLGDSMIYLFATLLPMPYRIFAASIGASIADLTLAPIYTIPTIIIKAAMAIWFTNKKSSYSFRNFVVLIPSTIILIAGYLLYDITIYGKESAFFYSQFTLIQGIANAIVFITLSIILSKSKAYTSFKEELM